MQLNAERTARMVIVGLAIVWVAKVTISSLQSETELGFLGLRLLEDVARHLTTPSSILYWAILGLLYLAFRVVFRKKKSPR